MQISLGHLRLLPLGDGLLQRLLQLLNCRPREDHTIITKQVTRMYFRTRHQLYAVEIPRTQVQIAIMLPGVRVHVRDNQRSFLNAQRVQCFAQVFRLARQRVETINHDQLAIRELCRQSRTQCSEQFLFRKREIVASRLRSVDRATVTPERRTNRANTRPASSLLLPQLSACAGDELLILGRVGTRALSCAVMRDRLPDQVFIDRAEDLVCQLEAADFLALQIYNVNLCHGYFLAFPAAAFFAAFNGSTVCAPANPRRSRGACLALLMTTYPPLGPGTAPSTINRFSSRSIPRMRRLRTVHCSTPI